MRDWKLPWTGSCRCGDVEILVGKAPVCTAACHCRGCQKMASSAFSLTAMVPADGFAVTKGETAIGGAHGPDLHHHFCPRCMSWMFTRIEGVDWFLNVRPTMLDDLGWFSRPFMETFTSTKLPFVETGAVRSFEKFPAMEELPGLLEDFAAWAG